MSARSRWLPLTTFPNVDGSNFLNPDDITDSLAQEFITTQDPRVSQWLEQVDGELLSVAQEREVTLTSISMPLHPEINEYACYYFCFLCFQDSFGRNDPGRDKISATKV